MDYYISKSDAARRLGITVQSVIHLLKNGRACLLREHPKGILVSSLYAELKRRYEEFSRAFVVEEGMCHCGCFEKTTRVGNRVSIFKPGHDRRLRSTMKTIFMAGDSLDRDCVITLAKERGIKFEDFLNETELEEVKEDF